MQLSIRLAAIADFVPQGSRVIDVGTDHAYIPIYLRKMNLAVTCLATDINKGPLKKAEKNIHAYGISGIRLKQTNGLAGLDQEEADVIMISGMGGYLIIDILSRALPLVTRTNKLILQPQQDVDKVRRYLHDIGFKIEDEAFVKEDDKYYTIISAIQGEEHYDTLQDYLYGKCLIKKKNAVFNEWVDYKIAKQEDIYVTIASQESASANIRKQELLEEISRLKEVKKCLN